MDQIVNHVQSFKGIFFGVLYYIMFLKQMVSNKMKKRLKFCLTNSQFIKKNLIANER